MDAENRWWVAELVGADCEMRMRGSIQDGKTPCRSEKLGLKEMKKVDGKRKMEELHQLNVNQLTEKCWASAQTHEAHSMEGRTTRRRCQAVGPL